MVDSTPGKSLFTLIVKSPPEPNELKGENRQANIGSLLRSPFVNRKIDIKVKPSRAKEKVSNYIFSMMMIHGKIPLIIYFLIFSYINIY